MGDKPTKFKWGTSEEVVLPELDAGECNELIADSEQCPHDCLLSMTEEFGKISTTLCMVLKEKKHVSDLKQKLDSASVQQRKKYRNCLGKVVTAGLIKQNGSKVYGPDVSRIYKEVKSKFSEEIKKSGKIPREQISNLVGEFLSEKVV